jgi:hypothetical protein
VQPLQVQTGAVGVHREFVGELLSRGRAPNLAEQRE